MKALIVTGIFPPDLGGPANYVPKFAAALARDHEIVAVVTLSDSLEHNDAAYPFPVHRLLRGESKVARRWRTIRAIARLSRQADVVYLNGLVLEGVVAARLLCRRPVVVKVVGDLIWEQARNRQATDLGIDAFQDRGRRTAWWSMLHGLQGLYTGAADRIITPSDYLAKMVAGWVGGTDRIRVVRNAVQPPETPDDVVPLHDLVTVARLTPWKGVEALIDICADRDWSLLVVGDGELRQSLEDRARQRGARVVFTGSIPNREVAGQIRSAKVFVLNSTYEGLPHIVLEAKLAGRPVVATAVGGTPETIHSGVDGYLAPVGDNAALGALLDRLLDDEAHRLAIARAGEADARERFSFERMYAQTVAVLSEAAARG